MDDHMLQFTVEASKQTIQPDVQHGYVYISAMRNCMTLINIMVLLPDMYICNIIIILVGRL